jgi:hypothetical protein
MTRLLHGIGKIVRRRTPVAVLDVYRMLRHGRTWYDPTGQPVRKVFAEIYRRRLWGLATDGRPYYSGPGSEIIAADSYVKSIRGLMALYHTTCLVDLGCGDFRVGASLVQPGICYHGVDIVDDVIRFNQKHFAARNITFSCRDIITDGLPAGDMCLVRQVLQHLSNSQVLRILEKCEQYPYVVVTEHLPGPPGSWHPNIDIHHGHETRVDRGSGVLLDAEPFNHPLESVICEVVMPDGTLLQSVLIVNNAQLAQK